MIRDITKEDKSIFLKMAADFYSSKAVMYSIDIQIHETNFDTALSKSPFMRALIIEDGGAPVGYALLSFSYSTEAGGLVILLEDLYISESCRGKGLGHKFMQFIEQEYPTAKRFRLEVVRDNKKAIDLYSKFGYKQLDYMQMIKDI